MKKLLVISLLLASTQLFAEEVDLNKTEQLKPSYKNSIDFSDRRKYSENRFQVNTNLVLDENNKLNIRYRKFNDAGANDIFSYDDGKKGESSNTRIRLFTQTGIENFEVRTQLYSGGVGSTLKIQPTYYLRNDETGHSLVRLGLGTNYNDDANSDFTFYSSFENTYSLNDFISLENNYYYDKTFARERSKNNKVTVEAYVYLTYPLLEKDNFKLSINGEGGVDPYSFSDRSASNLDNADKESYALYAQTSFKGTYNLSDATSVYGEIGYYYVNSHESNHGEVASETKQDKDTGFVTVGLKQKF